LLQRISWWRNNWARTIWRWSGNLIRDYVKSCTVIFLCMLKLSLEFADRICYVVNVPNSKPVFKGLMLGRVKNLADRVKNSYIIVYMV
jgi:hypothetical protein